MYVRRHLLSFFQPTCTLSMPTKPAPMARAILTPSPVANFPLVVGNFSREGANSDRREVSLSRSALKPPEVSRTALPWISSKKRFILPKNIVVSVPTNFALFSKNSDSSDEIIPGDKAKHRRFKPDFKFVWILLLPFLQFRLQRPDYGNTNGQRFAFFWGQKPKQFE
jgi:hypothetical protein